MQMFDPPHPGELLLEEFIKPLGLTQKELSIRLTVSTKTISEICNNKRAISPIMALKLSKLFGTTPEFWLNAQKCYDLYVIYEKNKEEIEKIKPLRK